MAVLYIGQEEEEEKRSTPPPSLLPLRWSRSLRPRLLRRRLGIAEMGHLVFLLTVLGIVAATIITPQDRNLLGRRGSSPRATC